MGVQKKSKEKFLKTYFFSKIEKCGKLDVRSWKIFAPLRGNTSIICFTKEFLTQRRNIYIKKIERK